MNRLLLVCFVLLGLTSADLTAQSLADVAKKEEARRKETKGAGKVYTNGDLRRDITTPSNATPVAPTPSTQVPQVTLPGGKAADDQAPGEKKDEKYWRERITAARTALERTRIFADALQSRINALTTDFVNRDDPAQRGQISLDRQRAVAELDRVKKEITDQTKAIADIEEEARKAGVPPGWLR